MADFKPHPAATPKSLHSLPISSLCVIVGVGVIVTCYALSLLVGWPQGATALVVKGMNSIANEQTRGHSETDSEKVAITPLAEESPPPLYMVIPFVFMLGTIAVMPLLHGTKHWWESNLHRFYVVSGLASLTVLYYALAHEFPIIGHFPAHHVSTVQEDETFHLGTVGTLLANAVLNEYLPFIILLFSLYTISGGIRIEGNLRARPSTNLLFFAIGGVLASFIGTTGAAMVLIRPLLETNRERKYITHTVIFFTFIVCNCGGCLLPLGDPPLFLGYLEGVPFLWTMKLWKEWLFINGSLLAIYWLWDHFYFYSHEEKKGLVADKAHVRQLRFTGLGLNGLLLAGVILAVAFLDPSKVLPGTSWHPWLYLREVLMLGLLALSLLFGSAQARKMNDFDFVAIVEVAVLFLGIFICMQPALQILNAQGESLGLHSPHQFFWATGTLSSFLDNAPTYLVFFEVANAMTQSPGAGILALQSGHFIREDLLRAISLGAVFMGAMTYIGNGPNFMVKSIAESWGVRMPSFFGYMIYSCVILLPLFILLNLLFL